MSRVVPWNKGLAAACLLGALCLPSGVQAEKAKFVSGLVGAQDTQSKEWLALSPAEADQLATRQLFSLLKPVGRFTQDDSHNVEGMTFLTQPYSTDFPYVCRQDRVTLEYRNRFKFDAAGKRPTDDRRPFGVEAQATFHIAQLPVQIVSGKPYSFAACDASHLGASAKWIAAPRDIDAIVAANMFRMAVDNAKAGRPMPESCDQNGPVCDKWLVSLDDLSKVVSVEPCAASDGDSACYVISFDGVDVTITGKMSPDDNMRITPAEIISVRIDNVFIVKG
jgi:hypothetical protein